MADNPSVKRKRGRGGGRVGVGFRKATSEDQAPEQEEEPLLLTEEYEMKKRRLLRHAVLAENQFIEVRTLLKNKKSEALEKYRREVAEKRCKVYTEGKEKAEAELERKNNINSTRHELKEGQILDEFNAEMEINETQFNDQLTYAQHRFIDFFESLIKEKTKRQREAGILLGALLSVPPIPNAVTAEPVFKDVVYAGRITRSRSKTRRLEGGV